MNIYEELFYSMHPDFFKQEYLKDFSEENIYEEMILFLSEFDEQLYKKEFSQNISFGFYEGDVNSLKKIVAKVSESWVQYFNEDTKVFCGYVDGNIACFCIVDDMGEVMLDGKSVKVAGPGCVGTVPEFRNQGLGLTMVKKVTEFLKAEGYDLSYIHYTGVAPWYAKLGYKTVLRWNKNGFIF